jgi:hypothetical protein
MALLVRHTIVSHLEIITWLRLRLAFIISESEHFINVTRRAGMAYQNISSRIVLQAACLQHELGHNAIDPTKNNNPVSSLS